MSVKVLTLFGEELLPEPVKPQPKKRVAKKAVAAEKEEPAIEKPVAEKKTRELKKADALNGWAGDKQYYTIGEVAILFKVNTSNIRFWTKEFEMKVRTTRKGDRLYTPENVREINTIYQLVKEMGFTINGAKAKMKSSKKAAFQTVDLRKSLLQLRNKLLQIRNNLT